MDKRQSSSCLHKKGFTLLELLIVISILSILSVAVILVLNPAETLRKARDSQRISDLASLKTALGIYTTSLASPDLDAAIATHCLTDTAGTTTVLAKISYSATIADVACNPTAPGVAEGADVATGAEFADGIDDLCRYVGATGADAVDGTGWVPVKLTDISGGSPLSNLPLDPTNTVAIPTAPASTDLVYRYACQNKTTVAGKPSTVFEIDAQLESAAFTVDDDKRTKDGGDNTSYYEVGTSTKLIGTGTNF